METEKLLDRVLEATNMAGIDSLESLIVWLPVMLMPDDSVEPAAYMYPSDLERFQTVGEHAAEAFSLEVGNMGTGERSVPVFRHPPAKLPVRVNENAVQELAEELKAELVSGIRAQLQARVEIPLANEAWVQAVLADINRYILARLAQDSAFGRRTPAIEESRERRAALEETLRSVIPDAKPWTCYADQKPGEEHVDTEKALWVSVDGSVIRQSLKRLVYTADWHGAEQVFWKTTGITRPAPHTPARKTDRH